jgi:hypothetical protein
MGKCSRSVPIPSAPPGSTFVGDPQQAIATHVIMHVVAGKVTRLFGIFDEAGLLRQLGVLPTN